MLGRLKTRTLLLTAAVVLSAGVVSFNGDDTLIAKNDMCQCSTTVASQHAQANVCKLESHTSWYAWLTGGSSNAQFHYLDLLELLLGSGDEQTASQFSQF
ncbi:hypothetical protein L1285_18280 [Pseudoalteromonas sp. DL2-H2.2]|uniref:Uncharacterized protein n=1 Tax=Pseudoalteromonas rubra TaxID=43658 RepID=A0A0F4QNI2_9GAMM|nr:MULTISPECIES: hypothetical protein [Pseudoalteromonas]KJZ09206.1 hypothetical protein TW77_10530 [Pseudoalteromonas rubra]MCF2910268.1 hypothetical protein [Pseudoalteromonas sp. DL2-H2.2]